MTSAPPVEYYQMYSYGLSGGDLNRYEAERQNKDKVPQLLQERLAQQPHLVVFSPSSREVLVSATPESTHWFLPLQPPSGSAVSPSLSPSLKSLNVKTMAEVIFVGEFASTGVNLFVTSSDNVVGELLASDGARTCTWMSTRHHDFIESLPRPEQAALGLCLSLHTWHRSHSFCSQCGERTDPTVDLGFSRHCPRCHTQHFPRIMPAMIAAVFDGHGNVLLSRRSLKSDIYTVLSGFALLGESFEETVVREVREETGAAVTFMRYIGSQPWPYPYLVMLVYYAVAPNSPRLTLEEAELVDIKWVSKEEVRLALEGANPRLHLHGPGTTPYAMLKPWVDGHVDDWGRPVGDEHAQQPSSRL